MDTLSYSGERKRRKKEFAISCLGGKCADCGTTEDLQFDHSDPEHYTLLVNNALGFSDERLKQFLIDEKIQLLCQPCHSDKTLRECGWL